VTPPARSAPPPAGRRTPPNKNPAGAERGSTNYSKGWGIFPRFLGSGFKRFTRPPCEPSPTAPGAHHPLGAQGGRQRSGGRWSEAHHTHLRHFDPFRPFGLRCRAIGPWPRSRSRRRDYGGHRCLRFQLLHEGDVLSLTVGRASVCAASRARPRDRAHPPSSRHGRAARGGCHHALQLRAGKVISANERLAPH
jgi:hypothetical protein